MMACRPSRGASDVMSELPISMADVAPRLVRRLSAARDTDAALGALLDDVVAATGADAGVVYRWDVERALLVRVSSTPPPPDFDATVRPGRGPLGEAAERRAPCVVAGSDAEATGSDATECRGLGCLVAVPLVHADRLVGAVAVGRRAADLAPEDDLGVLEAFATLAGPVLALIGADAREAVARRRYETLTQAARALAHDLNNDLTMPVGALELMRDRDDLPADVQELITAAADDLTRVEARIRAFQQAARGGP